MLARILFRTSTWNVLYEDGNNAVYKVCLLNFGDNSEVKTKHMVYKSPTHAKLKAL